MSEHMCCRFYTEESPEMLSFVEAAQKSPLLSSFHRNTAASLITSGDVCPTNISSVIASSRRKEKQVYPMQWGFTIANRPLIINARAESAWEKPLFREAWQLHRCVIPASYYFEWEHRVRYDGKIVTGQKYLLQTPGNNITWMCGLYRIEGGLPHYVILTRAPGEELRFLHDRMPLIIAEQDVNTWILPDTDPRDVLKRSLDYMYYEKSS